jgi:hypothetical protein
MVVFLNLKNGKLFGQPMTQINDMTGGQWILGLNSDMALIPFAARSDFDIKSVPESLFLPSTQLIELQDLFFISFQPGIQSADAITPVTRRGMVSVINADRTFYMDAFAFPGNSGSPVFVKPSATILPEGGISLGDPRGCRFVGVIGEYLPYQEVAFSVQTKRPRVVFEENTGLARVWPVQALQDIMNSSSFKAQHQKFKETPLKR